MILVSHYQSSKGSKPGESALDYISSPVAIPRSIVLAVDVSSSMLAEDFIPSNRLDVAKVQSVRFVEGREFDRIGLVAFAGEALTRVPITVDYDVLREAIRNGTYPTDADVMGGLGRPLRADLDTLEPMIESVSPGHATASDASEIVLHFDRDMDPAPAAEPVVEDILFAHVTR